MVVGLPHGLTHRAGIEAAAELAEWLEIELLATFVADSALPALAAMPGLRELRTLEQEWQSIDAERMSRDIEQAVALARRHFAESVSSRAIKTGFDVLTSAEAIGSIIRPDDILVIIEPAHPAERIARQFTELLDVAFSIAGAALFIPKRITQTAGPIVTEVSGPEDPGIRVALQVAAASGERLIVVGPSETGRPIELPAELKQRGVEIEYVAGALPWGDKSLPGRPGRLRPRLRIAFRGTISGDAHSLFSSLQGTPLLLIKPR